MGGWGGKGGEGGERPTVGHPFRFVLKEKLRGTRHFCGSLYNVATLSTPASNTLKPGSMRGQVYVGQYLAVCGV